MKGTGEDPDQTPGKTPKTATEIFREAFPRYLAIGMTYEQFWEQESWLVKSYREAAKLKQEDVNYVSWLNGLYIVRALRAGVPVVVNGFVKSGNGNIEPYPEKPIEFAESKEEKENNQMKLQVARMQQMAEMFNATFARKHGDDKATKQ